MGCTHVDDAVQLIRLEYLEMPGLVLTDRQAERLWNLPADLCRRALETLLETQFLARTRDGRYLRVADLGPEIALSRSNWRYRRSA